MDQQQQIDHDEHAALSPCPDCGGPAYDGEHAPDCPRLQTAYSRAVTDWDRLRAEREAERKRHEAEDRRLTAALREAERVIGLAERIGEDVATAYVTARDLLTVEWAVPRGGGARRQTPEVASCFRDAIEDLRRGGPALSRRYFGVKRYDRWDSQRHDSEYGMGPAHGSIWFRIGLAGAYRFSPALGGPRQDLTEPERLACVRWLHAVQADPDGTLR